MSTRIRLTKWLALKNCLSTPTNLCANALTQIRERKRSKCPFLELSARTRLRASSDFIIRNRPEMISFSSNRHASFSLALHTMYDKIDVNHSSIFQLSHIKSLTLCWYYCGDNFEAVGLNEKRECIHHIGEMSAKKVVIVVILGLAVSTRGKWYFFATTDCTRAL